MLWKIPVVNPVQEPRVRPGMEAFASKVQYVCRYVWVGVGGSPNALFHGPWSMEPGFWNRAHLPSAGSALIPFICQLMVCCVAVYMALRELGVGASKMAVVGGGGGGIRMTRELHLLLEPFAGVWCSRAP